MKTIRPTFLRICLILSLAAIAASSFVFGADALKLVPASSFEDVAPHYGLGGLLMLVTAAVLTLVMQLTFAPRRTVQVQR